MGLNGKPIVIIGFPVRRAILMKIKEGRFSAMSMSRKQENFVLARINDYELRLKALEDMVRRLADVCSVSRPEGLDRDIHQSDAARTDGLFSEGEASCPSQHVAEPSGK